VQGGYCLSAGNTAQNSKGVGVSCPSPFKLFVMILSLIRLLLFFAALGGYYCVCAASIYWLKGGDMQHIQWHSNLMAASFVVTIPVMFISMCLWEISERLKDISNKK
jgi:cellulose synthase/poly-beta-1,6-N-acetylglucosamine synthase-like glycosyltransferase